MRKIGTFIVVFLLVLSYAHPTMAYAQASVHIALLGDSNTWLGGDECDKPMGWPYWFCEQLKPASCRSYARSGATWTHTAATKRNTKEYTEKLSDDNVIYNQVCRLQEAVKDGRQPPPQLIIIAAGTNDAWFSQKRPHVFDFPSDNTTKNITDRQPNDVLTLAEVVRYNCELLQKDFPESRILLLAPMQSTAVATNKINAVSDIIETVAKQMGAEVIRMDKESCVRRNQEAKRRQYTYDGTHTNEKGAQQNGYYIAQKVNALLQK